LFFLLSLPFILVKNDRNGVPLVLPATVGPIARSVEDCALFMKTVCVPEMWQTDFGVPPVPFDQQQYEKSGKLKIGYFETDGWFHPCATASRGLNETIEKLRAAGHTCVPFEPPTDGKFNYTLYVEYSFIFLCSRHFLTRVVPQQTD
jgi:Asp-tRNA(Asn)/Glu-tRNA(Gln) amidotransferase A subunit family amidase